MKKLGIVGGLGPASTIDYYKGIIEQYTKAFGNDNYPAIVIDSVNMKEIVERIALYDYEGVAECISKSIACLEKAGAEFAAIASNTPHIAWKYFEEQTTIPIISIIQETCHDIKEKQYRKVLIFGTKYTMKNGLYSDALTEYGLNWVLPSEEDIEILGNIIYPNLENGVVIPEDKQHMIEIAETYIEKFGCDSLLLGCTEIPLMIKEGEVSVPLINTTQIHIDALAKLLIQGHKR